MQIHDKCRIFDKTCATYTVTMRLETEWLKHNIKCVGLPPCTHNAYSHSRSLAAAQTTGILNMTYMKIHAFPHTHSYIQCNKYGNRCTRFYSTIIYTQSNSCSFQRNNCMQFEKMSCPMLMGTLNFNRIHIKWQYRNRQNNCTSSHQIIGDWEFTMHISPTKTIDGSTARRCIAIVTNERRASYVIPLNSSWESRLKTP